MPETQSPPVMGMAAAEGIEDPFEAFNAASGQGSVRDPYPIFAAARLRWLAEHVLALRAKQKSPRKVAKSA